MQQQQEEEEGEEEEKEEPERQPSRKRMKLSQTKGTAMSNSEDLIWSLVAADSSKQTIQADVNQTHGSLALGRGLVADDGTANVDNAASAIKGTGNPLPFVAAMPQLDIV